MRKLLALTLAFGLVGPTIAATDAELDFGENDYLLTDGVSRNYMDTDVDSIHPVQDAAE
jgi:hypothetical protein